MSDQEIIAYCMKCRATRPIQDATPVYMKNGRPATRGVCSECDTGLFKIGKTTAHVGLPIPEITALPKRKAALAASMGPAPEDVSAPLTASVEAYCVKCKAKRPVKAGRAIFMANARPAAEGVCLECGTKLFKIGKTGDHEGLPQPVPRPKKREKQTATKAAKSAKKATSKQAKRRRTGKLVIVESPAKARTVGRFLGRGYDVRASVGHVRDLLRSKLSVDLERDFEPTYRVPNEKRDVVKSLKAAAAGAKDIYLATDPDREGEAIAWHLLEAAEIPSDRTQRVVFHEITKDAIAEAFAHSRDIDMQLVDAQQARRILDRLVGYQISPLLWDRVRSRLSAGRVQSVALRLIVEREREIAAFVPEEYWTIDADLAQQTTRSESQRPSFLARLVRMGEEAVQLKKRDDTQAILAHLRDAAYDVSSVKRGERRRRPNAPFTTSTLQQDAAQRLGMTARRTMRVAQQLYEGVDIGDDEGAVGLITYMRTDSVNVAKEAQEEARAVISAQYGPEYLPPKPNVYRSRAKNAQEAHEAVRPTSSRRTPAAVRRELSRDQYRLYELIWQRFVASQMAAAVYDTLAIEVEAGSPADTARPYLFRASGSQVRFPGFLVVYGGGATGVLNGNGNGAGRNGSDAGKRTENGDLGARAGQDKDARERLVEQEVLPDLRKGEPLDLIRLLPEQHFTQPPPRYNEASLVRTLEENGIGRPSTYASIISTILDRGYVGRDEKRLLPTELGFTVNDLLVKHFDSLFNVGFTADMEERLDSIATGQADMVPVLRAFYDSFAPQLSEAERTMEKVVVEPEKTGEQCPDCGGDLLIKFGRYGKFVGCSTYPTCRFTKPLIVKVGVKCPKDGGDLAERRTKRGRVFYGCVNYPECDFTSWKRPLPQPCPHCGGLLVVANKQWAQCIDCHERMRLEELKAEA